MGWVMWWRAQRPVIYYIAFNIRNAGLFAEAPRRSVRAIGSRRGFFLNPAQPSPPAAAALLLPAPWLVQWKLAGCQAELGGGKE